MPGFRSYSLRESNIKKDWYLIDAGSATVGRLASTVAMILMGKHKPCYTPHMDCGDNVVIVNARNSRFSGRKVERKTYHWHTGYPGGIKEASPARWLATDGKCDRVLKRAISGMLGKNVLGRIRMKNVYIYPGAEHKHAGQQPKSLDILKGYKSVLGSI